MSDPLGLIGAGGSGALGPAGGAARAGGVGGAGQGGRDGGDSDFRKVLIDNLNKVNAAQQEADRAVEDLVTGRRSDVEGVILATQKADNAFQLLQAMRGKVLQAYDEIKQIRV